MDYWIIDHTSLLDIISDEAPGEKLRMVQRPEKEKVLRKPCEIHIIKTLVVEKITYLFGMEETWEKNYRHLI